MAVWRRKALASFPRYAEDLADRTYTIYQLFFDLLPDWGDARESQAWDEVGRIARFAEWCFDQEELNNAVCVAFYEHLFDDHWEDREAIVRGIAPRIANAVLPLWEARLPAPRAAEVRQLVAPRGGRHDDPTTGRRRRGGSRGGG